MLLGLCRFCFNLISQSSCFNTKAYYTFVVGKTGFSSDEDDHVVGDCVKVLAWFNIILEEDLSTFMLCDTEQVDCSEEEENLEVLILSHLLMNGLMWVVF